MTAIHSVLPGHAGVDVDAGTISVDAVAMATGGPGHATVSGLPVTPSLGRAVVVPDLSGLGLSSAVELARPLGVTVSSTTRRHSGSLVARVVAQRPAPGARLKVGSSIHVDLGSTSRVAVPDVCLATERDAIERITAAGLRPGHRAPRPRPASGRPKVVMRTYPRVGTLMPVGSQVDYDVLPGGPREGRPTLTGYQDFDAAACLLHDSCDETSISAVGGPISAGVAQPATSGYLDWDTLETAGGWTRHRRRETHS